MKTIQIRTISVILALFMLSIVPVLPNAVAEEKIDLTEFEFEEEFEEEFDSKDEEEMARVAQQTNNPVGDLWMLVMQNDFSIFDGEITDGKRIRNSFKFQPVAPLLLTEKIRLINRPVFQFQSFETPSIDRMIGPSQNLRDIPKTSLFDWETEHGLGDTVFLQALAPAEMDENVWGLGWTWLFPTATDSSLGAKKWAVGPAATAFHLGKKWVLGGVFQHWWDFAGDDERSNINVTDFQYVIRYKINPFFQIGTGPNIQYNWETEELSLPVGLGLDTTTKWGNTIFRFGFDLQYYIEQDDKFGPKWNLRFFVIPVIKAPQWARKAVFGE